MTRDTPKKSPRRPAARRSRPAAPPSAPPATDSGPKAGAVESVSGAQQGPLHSSEAAQPQGSAGPAKAPDKAGKKQSKRSGTAARRPRKRAKKKAAASAQVSFGELSAPAAQSAAPVGPEAQGSADGAGVTQPRPATDSTSDKRALREPTPADSGSPSKPRKRARAARAGGGAKKQAAGAARPRAAKAQPGAPVTGPQQPVVAAPHDPVQLSSGPVVQGDQAVSAVTTGHGSTDRGAAAADTVSTPDTPQLPVSGADQDQAAAEESLDQGAVLAPEAVAQAGGEQVSSGAVVNTVQSSQRPPVATGVVAGQADQVAEPPMVREGQTAEPPSSPEAGQEAQGPALDTQSPEQAQLNFEPAVSEPSEVTELELQALQQQVSRLLREAETRKGGRPRRESGGFPLVNDPRRDGLGAGRERGWSMDAWARRWGRLGMRFRADEVDGFGHDQVFDRHMRPVLDVLFENYFRAQVAGMEHVPRNGRVLFVCNRGGWFSWDGLMLKLAVAKYGPATRELRWLVEDSVFHAPFIGTFLSRLGAVRACPENAERLLVGDGLLAVFPEGLNGARKPYADRYQLQRFGRGGAIKLALRTGTPVLPVAVVGPEDAYPLLYRLGVGAKFAGLPFVPITPTFPWLGPLGLLPLPSRFAIRVGPPVAELQGLGPEAATDPNIVHGLNERLRITVQQLVDEARSERGDRVFL